MDSEEINFIELFVLFWKSKLIILSSIFFGLFISVIHLNDSIFTYDIKLDIVPVDKSQSNKSSFPSSYNSLANSFGINLSSGNTKNNFDLYLEMLKSRVVAEKLSNDKSFMIKFFPSQWDEVSQSWKEPEYSSFERLKRLVRGLIGIPIFDKSKPNYNHVHRMISKISVSNSDENFITTLRIETSDFELGKYLLNSVHKTTDDLIKERSKKRSSDYINFITRQLEKTLNADERISLIQTLNSEVKNKIATLSEMSFVADPISSAYSSERPTKPQPTIVLLFGMVIGFFIGISYVILRFLFFKKTQ